VTHDELAGLCGMSRKTLGRILGELKQAGAIEINYGSIAILDLKLLGDIAADDISRQPADGLAAE